MRCKDGSPVAIKLVTRILPHGHYLAVGCYIKDLAKSLSQLGFVPEIEIPLVPVNRTVRFN